MGQNVNASFDKVAINVGEGIVDFKCVAKCSFFFADAIVADIGWKWMRRALRSLCPLFGGATSNDMETFDHNYI